MYSKWTRYLAIGFVLALVNSLRAEEPFKMQFNDVKEVAPGVFFRYSSISATDPKVPFGGSNNIWVVFEDYVVVIDANFPKEAADVLQAIRRTTDKPVRYVLDTHHHGDHAYGNAVWVKEGATIVSQRRCFELLRTVGPEEFKKAGEGPQGRKDVASSVLKAPTLAFDDKLILDDGKQRVEFHFLGHAHTAGDAVAYLPNCKILCTGDACVNGAFNYMGHSDSASWIKVLDRMEQFDVKYICPGHGPVATRDLFGKQKRYFQDLRQAVKRGIDDNNTLDDIVASVEMPWYKEWTGKPAKLNKENIEHVYKELTGQIMAYDLIEELGTPAGKGYHKNVANWAPPRRVVVPNISPARLMELKRVAPNIEFVTARTGDEAARSAGEADAVLGFCSTAIIHAGTKLRWIQVGNEAINDLLPELVQRGITLSTSESAAAPQLADQVFAMLLAQASGPRKSLQDVDWRKLKPAALPKEVRGQVLLVIGTGPIPKEVARRGESFGLRVLVVDPQGQLAPAIKDADFIVLAGSMIDAGAVAFGEDCLRIMKPTAQLINVGRGMVNLASLQKALEGKTIAGAGLSLTDRDPLPIDHPLWRMPNVVIIPQAADQSPEGTEKQWRLLRENIRRFTAGEPLLGVVEQFSR